MLAHEEAGLDYVVDVKRLFQHVAVGPNPAPLCPPELASRIIVETVHDGRYIPEAVLESPGVAPLDGDGTLRRHYITERDWGANLVASQLAHALGLSGYFRVNVARVVMDFNRFPGCTQPGTGPLDRFAINPPLADLLSHREKSDLLTNCYDVVSKQMEAQIRDKLMKISIHTYDERNESRTLRPEVSLLTRSLSYQSHSKLPSGLFDPLFPDILAESSATRILRDRIALSLEKAGVNVEHNYPYCLPDGSLEIRTQVWFFFEHLRRAFEAARPESREDPAFRRVFAMLANTNLRHAESEALSGYLHRFSHVRAEDLERFEAARLAYEEVARFLHERPEMVEEYRLSPDRPSSMAIEVRKDLVCRFVHGIPVGQIRDRAERIARRIAEGIGAYLTEDRAGATAVL